MMKRYMHGELAPDTPKAPNEPMAIDPNAKVKQGGGHTPIPTKNILKIKKIKI